MQDSNSEMSCQNIPLKDRADTGMQPAEFRPHRPFALELRRGRCAARTSCQHHFAAQRRRLSNTIAHFAMDFQRTESVVAVNQPDALASVALAVIPDAVGRARFLI
jgi:hypothetical protein